MVTIRTAVRSRTYGRLSPSLYRVGERVIDRDTLLRDVWGHTGDADTHTLETHVYNLRKKIESDPSKPEILLGDRDGYQLVV